MIVVQFVTKKIMDFKNFDWSFKSIAKIIGLVVAGIIVLTIVMSLISLSFKTVFYAGNNYDDYGDYEEEVTKEIAMSDSASVRSLNQQIVLPPSPEEPAIGDTAEDFEIREHNGTVRTRKLSETCGKIADLKKLDYVVFENANEGEKSCNYNFKVKIDRENEILEIVESLKPESFNTQRKTIKRIVDDYDSELDILNKKLASIETTLSDAQNTYDDLQKLATEKEDIESLAKIIDSKLNLIDRLTQQRIEIRTEIDQFNKAKSEQLDRLNYAYFNLNIYEDLYIDFERIKDTWKREIKSFVRNVNEMLQNLSVNLVEYILNFLLVSVYFFISLGLLKVVWVVTKRIWRGKK